MSGAGAIGVIVALLVVSATATAQEAPRPAHPAVRFSCMSDPPDGAGWPWVTDGVPYTIERMHPGYAIEHYGGFTIEGLRLFVIVGMRRADDVSERYAEVEAADEHDAFVGGRALFLRSITGVSDAYAMALRAMAILMRRADERPLRSEPSDISEYVRGRVGPPTIAGRTLTFWIRNRADEPYASLITVDLDTGILGGDPG